MRRTNVKTMRSWNERIVTIHDKLVSREPHSGWRRQAHHTDTCNQRLTITRTIPHFSQPNGMVAPTLTGIKVPKW